NPEIHWTKHTVKFSRCDPAHQMKGMNVQLTELPSTKDVPRRSTVRIEEVEDEYWRMLRKRDEEDEGWARKVTWGETPVDVKKHVPEKYWEFADVFQDA